MSLLIELVLARGCALNCWSVECSFTDLDSVHMLWRKCQAGHTSPNLCGGFICLSRPCLAFPKPNTKLPQRSTCCPAHTLIPELASEPRHLAVLDRTQAAPCWGREDLPWYFSQQVCVILACCEENTGDQHCGSIAIAPKAERCSLNHKSKVRFLAVFLPRCQRKLICFRDRCGNLRRLRMYYRIGLSSPRNNSWSFFRREERLTFYQMNVGCFCVKHKNKFYFALLFGKNLQGNYQGAR